MIPSVKAVTLLDKYFIYSFHFTSDKCFNSNSLKL